MSKKQHATETHQIKMPFSDAEPTQLTISMLETWLLDVANTIRGASNAPKLKDFILLLIFYKRLSDGFDDEFEKRIAEFDDEEITREIIEKDQENVLKTGRNPIVRFYIPLYYRK